jgi:hypothetical protein
MILSNTQKKKYIDEGFWRKIRRHRFFEKKYTRSTDCFFSEGVGRGILKYVMGRHTIREVRDTNTIKERKDLLIRKGWQQIGHAIEEDTN